MMIVSARQDISLDQPTGPKKQTNYHQQKDYRPPRQPVLNPLSKNTFKGEHISDKLVVHVLGK